MDTDGLNMDTGSIRFETRRAAPPGVNLRPRLTFEALSGYGGSARWFHRGRGVPRRVGEDTQSSSGASGLGGRPRGPGRGSSRSVLDLVESRWRCPVWRRARVYLKMILGIHRRHTSIKLNTARTLGRSSSHIGTPPPRRAVGGAQRETHYGYGARPARSILKLLSDPHMGRRS